MLLPDDDELYEVDQTYLGPPGRYIGNFRFKAIAAWLVLGPLTFVVMRKLGVDMNLLTVGLAAMAVTYLAGEIADLATPERPLLAVAKGFSNDLKARRESTRGDASSAARYGTKIRPGSPLGRWIRHNKNTR